jgi:hypothetical protein
VVVLGLCTGAAELIRVQGSGGCKSTLRSVRGKDAPDKTLEDIRAAEQ